MTNSTQQASTSSSNALGGLGDALSNAFSGLSSGFSNMFSGGGGNNFITDPTGMSGTDVSGLFNNLSSDAFNQDTATAQATQAITPPAQAQAAAASGTDPAAPIGGAQSQTASTGPAPQQPPSQEQQNQEQRNKAVDELRRLLDQRKKNQPWQYPPREIAAFQAQPGIGRGPAGVEAGLYSPNISPEAAVRAGLLAPDAIDPTTGTIRRTPPPAAPAAPEKPPALPDPSGRTSSGQVVPAGEEGRQITVQPRAPLPARTVPGTPGAAPGTDVAPGTAPETFTAGEPMVNEPWYTNQGTFNIPGLPGLEAIPGWMLRGGALGAAGAALSPTPAETGELTPGQRGMNYRPEDDPRPTPPDPPPAPAPAPQAAPTKAAAPPRRRDPLPARREAPREVWVPPTPGHYIPTTGLGRGPGTWVPGTPGHYARVAGQGRPPAAVSPAAGPGARQPPEAAPEPSGIDSRAMAYSEEGMPPMLRDVLGISMPTMLAALARDERTGGPLRFARPNYPSSAYGQGGTRPYNENWGGRAYVLKGDEVQRGRQYMGYLTGKGLTRQGAAALLGNAHQESNLSATLAPGGDGGTAAGMFQWRGPRQAAFRQWLGANGRSESDANAHLDFALHEMQTNPAYRQSWEALHNPNLTVAQIADIIANNYEVSKRGPTQGMNNRIGFANSLLQGGGAAPATATASRPGGGLRISDPNPDPLTSHAYPAPGETRAAPALPLQASGGDAQA